MTDRPSSIRGEGWVPDGHGIPKEGLRLIDNNTQSVHLRLTNTGTGETRVSCDPRNTLGEWWTGVPTQVTCPRCLEVVPA